MPEKDREIYREGGWGGKQPRGNRPALLVVDVVESFTGSRPEEVLQAQREYPSSCGEAAWVALPQIRSLLQACRKQAVPVIYTKGDPDYKEWCGGSTKSWVEGDGQRRHGKGFPEMIAPLSSEFVLRKTKASAFFMTPLPIYLNRLGIDTLLVTGTSTSGCVRATVTDAFSHGYRVLVVEECCFDRSEFSHLVNLYEMNNKYADVITLEEAQAYISDR